MEAEEEGEEEEEERVLGQLVEKCPVCWQEKQTTCLSGFTEERRFAWWDEEEEEEEEGKEDLFLEAATLDAALLASAMALAICLASPVSCWKKGEKTKDKKDNKLEKLKAVKMKKKHCSRRRT